MNSKELTKEEITSWMEVISETYPIVLSTIVKNNILEPEKMGKTLAALDFYDFGTRGYIQKKQPEMIDWETLSMTQYLIQEMTCYRYFGEWTLGHHDDEHDTKISNKWKEFYQKHEGEVSAYMNNVLKGYLSYMKDIHKRYPNLEHPWLNHIREEESRKQEEKK